MYNVYLRLQLFSPNTVTMMTSSSSRISFYWFSPDTLYTVIDRLKGHEMAQQSIKYLEKANKNMYAIVP
jgi:hypothetical protein